MKEVYPLHGFEDTIERLETEWEFMGVGTVIPLAWYRYLRHKKGKFKGQAYTEAIILLADIVYWYRPEIDKRKPKDKSLWKKRFRGDRLQRAQRRMEVRYGFTEKGVKAALDFLVEEGLISKEVVKKQEIYKGTNWGNVTYFELHVDELIRISFDPTDESAVGYI